MDHDKQKRIQSFKIIFSEAIMVLAVIITVIVLAFVVSGYWVNSDFEVERQGLLQVSSFPTGADVEIDGDSSWLRRTNTSKTLPAGEHSIILTKEGYDSWSKTVNIREGLLYRLHYPRLFLEDREKEVVASMNNVEFVTVSPDRNTMLLAKSVADWEIVDLEDEKIQPQSIDLVSVLDVRDVSSGSSDSGEIKGRIVSADWAKDNAHVLLKLSVRDEDEWILLNIDDLKSSVNLSRKFATSFDSVEIVNNSANTLLALKERNLRRIDVRDAQISAVLVERVISLDHFENRAIFVSEDGSESGDKYRLGAVDISSGKTEELTNLESPAQVTISEFYEDKYITLLQGDKVSLYLMPDLSPVNTFELSFAPDTLKVGHGGEFIIMRKGVDLATLDMEAAGVSEWKLDSPDYGWVDDDMIYAINDGTLVVYDFDGLNRRTLADNLSGDYPVIITNNKWLYYFSDGSLVREWLIQR